MAEKNDLLYSFAENPTMFEVYQTIPDSERIIEFKQKLKDNIIEGVFVTSKRDVMNTFINSRDYHNDDKKSEFIMIYNGSVIGSSYGIKSPKEIFCNNKCEGIEAFSNSVLFDDCKLKYYTDNKKNHYNVLMLDENPLELTNYYSQNYSSDYIQLIALRNLLLLPNQLNRLMLLLNGETNRLDTNKIDGNDLSLHEYKALLNLFSFNKIDELPTKEIERLANIGFIEDKDTLIKKCKNGRKLMMIKKNGSI